MPKNQIHHGRNLKRIREILGMKQEALAMELGGNWNQQKISLLEQKEEFSRNMLQKVAQVLKISVDAIVNFTEETAILSIQQNPVIAVPGSESEDSNLNNDYSTSSRIDKWQLVFEENKKLYERLLQVEREKNELLQKQILLNQQIATNQLTPYS